MRRGGTSGSAAWCGALGVAAALCGLAAWAAAEAPAPPAAKTAAAPAGEGWKELFDGRSLAGWKVTDFGGHGEVSVKDGQLILEMGAMLTGVNYTNPMPKVDYEVSLEAMKLEGSDFFCGLTVPHQDSHFSLIVGGWGGGILGISSLDGYDASENETTKYLSFAKDRWYRIRLRVTAEKLQAWIDDEAVIDVKVADRKVALRPGEIESSAPFGIANYQTKAALRNLRYRLLPAK